MTEYDEIKMEILRNRITYLEERENRIREMKESLYSEGYEIIKVFGKNMIVKSDGENKWVVGCIVWTNACIMDDHNIDIIWFNEIESKKHKPFSWIPLQQEDT